MAKIRHVSLSSERDFPLLRFLWKWKLVSTAALAQKFFSNLSPITAYKRLWQLEQAGYVRSVSMAGDGKSFVWSIDRKGFHAIRESLPALRSEGFKSEHQAHDFLVSAFHLSDFLMEKPDEVALVSEQQLRRYDFEFYPKSVPRSELHRPDGYFVVHSPHARNVIAIEVELTPKRKADYEQVCEFYRHESIDTVLWLVPRPSLGKRLHRIFTEYQREHDSIHSFVSYDNFRTSGLGCKIMCGKHEGLSVRRVIGNMAETSPHTVSHESLLDMRKAPHRSKTYRAFTTQEILD